MVTERTRYRGTNLHQEHIDAWDDLARYAGMNPNQFLRFVLLKLSTSDVDELFKR
jgi:hypothetical protein